MNCDCVKEETTVVRKLNKTLRTMNKLLRSSLQHAQEQTDRVALLVFEDTAIQAMRELWERGDLFCSSEDYDAIVEACVSALEYRAEHLKPIASSSSA